MTYKVNLLLALIIVVAVAGAVATVLYATGSSDVVVSTGASAFEKPFWEEDPAGWTVPVAICVVLLILQCGALTCCLRYKALLRRVRERDEALEDDATKELVRIRDERTQVLDRLENLEREKARSKEEHAAALERIRQDEQSQSKAVDETVEKFAREQKEIKKQWEEAERRRKLERQQLAQDAQNEVDSQRRALDEALRQHARIKVKAEKLEESCKEHENAIQSLQSQMKALPDDDHYERERSVWRRDEEALLAEKRALDEELSAARAVHESRPDLDDAAQRLAAETSRLEEQVAELRRGEGALAEQQRAEQEQQARWTQELQELSDELARLQAQHETTKAALLDETSRVQDLKAQIAVHETRMQTFSSMRNMVAESHSMLESFQQTLESERKEKGELQRAMEQEHMRTALLMHILRQFKQKLASGGLGSPDAYEPGRSVDERMLRAASVDAALLDPRARPFDSAVF